MKTKPSPPESGYAIRHAIHSTNLAGNDLDDYLTKLLIESGYNTGYECDVSRDIKENYCYVNLNYDGETGLPGAGVEYELPDGQEITVDYCRSQCPEALFKPFLAGGEGGGIHQLTHEAIGKCESCIRPQLYSNVVLGGGGSLIPGIEARLEAELTTLAPAPREVHVTAPPDRKYSAWNGGSILAALSSFQKMWVNKQEYDECGPDSLVRKMSFS